jgi:hypothetical protein
MDACILQEHVAGSKVPNNCRRGRPEVALIIGALAPSGDGVGLARESRSDEIHDASPLVAVEGAYISPDGGVVERPVRDAGLDELLAVGVIFDIADRPRF